MASGEARNRLIDVCYACSIVAKTLKTGANRRVRTIREIAQRELRNDISRVLAAVERGARFRVTVRGRPVAEIVPIPTRKTWVPRDEVLKILRRAPLDENFMADVDGAVDNTIRDPWKRS
ncbi:MAG: type II toxin-antitoxin system prevent-host-death family antitoxin [Chloroflexi bacterium]|nr:MAG: type II toxin-antitoxin system prevent-host-death family antitoxin [Chloroflexota bacterium]